MWLRWHTRPTVYCHITARKLLSCALQEAVLEFLVNWSAMIAVFGMLCLLLMRELRTSPLTLPSSSVLGLTDIDFHEFMSD